MEHDHAPAKELRRVAQINVSINGRQFRMACEDGQEDHLLRLAKEFDMRVEKIRAQFGEVGDMTSPRGL